MILSYSELSELFHTSAIINGFLASRTFASIKNHMMCSIFMGSWFESHKIIGVGFIQFHGRTQICLRITRPEKMQYKFESKDINSGAQDLGGKDGHLPFQFLEDQRLSFSSKHQLMLLFTDCPPKVGVLPTSLQYTNLIIF